MDLFNSTGNTIDDGHNVAVSYRESSRTPSSKTTKVAKNLKAGFASAPIVAADNEVLRALPSRLFDLLKPHLRRMYVVKEQYLYQQDDELDYVYFPETAVISELHILDDGRMVEVSITGHEGVVGITTLFQATRISNCVQVAQAGNVLRIETSVLKKLSRIEVELPLHLQATLQTYIRQLSQKAVCNMYHSVGTPLHVAAYASGPLRQGFLKAHPRADRPDARCLSPKRHLYSFRYAPKVHDRLLARRNFDQ